MSEEKTETTTHSESEEDENPLKKKSTFVMTEARKETLARGRAKRQANIKKIQEDKMRKTETEKIVKKQVKKRIANEVREELEAIKEAKKEPEPVKQKAIKRVKTLPESSDEDSESSSDSDYEIEIKRRKKHREQPIPQVQLSERKYGVPIMFV